MIPLFLATLAHADDITVQAPITTVTVYRDRARVTRTAEVDLPAAGRWDLVFDGLPIGLYPASLASEGEGNASATLTGIDIRTDRGVEDRDAKVAELQKERLRRTDAIRVQQDRIARIQADLTYFRTIRPIAPPQLEAGLFLAADAASQLAGVADAVGENTAVLLKEQRVAEQAIRAEQREVDRIDRELQVIQNPGNTDSNRVAVGLDAGRSGHVTVRLTYVVGGASWVPHYDARYRPSDGHVDLDVSGDITQVTGEDWTDVELILSTARPQEGTAPPELLPFYLYQGGYGAVTGTTAGYAGGGPASGEYQYAQASVADRSTAFEFTASGTEDVPRDGRRKRVFLQSIALESKLEHHVVPRRMEAAFLVAHAKNPAAFTLLPGSVSAYMGSAYVGEGAIGVVPTGESLDLSFGVDDRVRVQRVRQKVQTDDAKALQNREKATNAWKTTITNRTGRPIDLLVTDQVPVSRDQPWQVDVELTPTVDVPPTGVFTWRQTVADGKGAEFVVDYTVSWPTGDAPVLME